MGASAIRVLAKSFEALDAFDQCEKKHINVSAVVLSYTVSYLAARSFCMLMGFSPLDRDSTVTLDSFLEDTVVVRGQRSSTSLLRLHKYTRWTHAAVWNLAARLINTIQVPDELSENVRWLRTIDITKTSHMRNTILYHDGQLAPFEESEYVDHPDWADVGIRAAGAPSNVKQQFTVARSLLRMCQFVVEESDLQALFDTYTCQRRSRLIA